MVTRSASGTSTGDTVTVRSEVISGFDARKTRAARTLKHSFPCSGELSCEIIEMSDATQMLSQTGHGVYSLDVGQARTDFLKALEDSSFDNRLIHSNNDEREGFISYFEGQYRFISFKPVFPDNAQMPQHRRLLGGDHLYEFDTSIHVDETCRLLLKEDRYLMKCVNLCISDYYQLGNRYRLRRNGTFVPAEETKRSRTRCRQWFRATVSNAADMAETALGIVAEASSVFPPVSATAKVVQKVLTIRNTGKDHRTEAEHQIDRARKLRESADELLRSTHDNEGGLFTRGHAEIINSACEEVKRSLQPVSVSGLCSRILRLNRNQGILQDSRRRLDAAERDFAIWKDLCVVRLNMCIKKDTTSLIATGACLNRDITQLKWLCSCIAVSIACF